MLETPLALINQFANLDLPASLKIDHMIHNINMDFDYATYNRLEFNKSKYTENEYQFFKEKSMIIAGMCNNVGGTIEHLLNVLEFEFSNAMKHVTIIIFESNSVDNTKILLHKWKMSNTNSNVKKMLLNETDFDNFQSINESKYEWIKYQNTIRKQGKIMDIDKQGVYYQQERMINYSQYRNLLLYTILQLTNDDSIENEKHDLLTFVDFDLISVNVVSILKEFYQLYLQNKANSDMLLGMCCNGILGYGKHRDSFATIIDSNDTLMSELNMYDQLYESIYSDEFEYKKYENIEFKNLPQFDIIRNKHLKMTGDTLTKQSNQFILPNHFTRVKSCFGGMTIYNLTIVLNGIINNVCQYIPYYDINYHSNEMDVSLYEKMNLLKYNSLLSILSIGTITQGFNTTAVCEHVPFNLCLQESTNNRAKLDIGKNAWVYYGFGYKFKSEMEKK